MVTEDDGTDHPAIVNRDGSSFRTLTNEQGERRVVGFSPDGSKVLYSYGKDIFVVGAGGSEPVRLIGENEHGSDAVRGDNDPVSFLPDGQLLPYNAFYGYEKDWRVNAANADGSNPRKLTDFPSKAVGFSPDGSKMLFFHSENGEVDVWTMDPDGQNKVNLTPDNDPNDVDSHQKPVAFTANGRRILYWDNGPEKGIMLMNWDGSDKTVVTANSPDVATAASSNGEIIAFYEAAMKGICPYCSAAGVGLIRSSGTGRTVLEHEQSKYTRIVDFSPSGRTALFGSTGGEGRSWKVLLAELKE